MDLLSTLGATIIIGSTVWVVVTKQKEKAVRQEEVQSSPESVRSFLSNY